MPSPVPYGDSGKMLSPGVVAPAYYFFGPLDVLKDEALAGLLDRVLDPSLRDFNYDQRSATQLQPEDVESLTSQTLPMMADRRLVVIRDVESWAKKARAKAAGRAMELITPRLKLREFAEGDYSSLREMDSRPEMWAYEREIPQESDTRDTLVEFIKNQTEEPRTTYRFATVPSSTWG